MNSWPLIGIDCRFASEHAGLGTYTRGIVTALLKRDDPWRYVLFVHSQAEPWVSEFALSDRVSFQVAPFAHYSFGEQWHFPMLLRASACDLFYSPHFNVPILTDTPFVCTVHDVILHRFPNQAGFFRRLAYRFVLGHAIRKSQAIITVSETTMRDLTGLSSHSKQHTHVVYPGVDPIFRRVSQASIESVRSKYGLSKPFILYVGNCKEHKNVPVLLRAFSDAHLQNVELLLVSSGKECDALPLPMNVRILRRVDEEDLPLLYSAALGCVSATLYEGFGLPMIEAMACGCPVLATKCGSLSEVCGEHALLVEPTVDAMAEGIRNIVSDPLYRSQQRLDAASAFVKRYDWQKSVEKLAGIFAQQLRSCACPP